MYYYLGTKKGLFISFLLETAFGVGILLYGVDNQDSVFFILLVLSSDFFCNVGWQILYVAHTTVFPTLFASTSFGFCNFLARLMAAASPEISLLKEPAPMIIYTIVSALLALLVLGLHTDKKHFEVSEKHGTTS